MENLYRKKALWIELSVVILWLVLPSILTQFISYKTSRGTNGDVYHIVYALAYIGRVGALGFIVWQSGDSFSSFGIIKDSLPRVALIVIVLLALDAAMMAIMNPSHILPHVSPSAFSHDSSSSWFSRISFIVAAATMEELIYRSYLITRLKELLGSAEWAIVISFILFGCIHIYRGTPGFISASAFGLILSIAFVRTKSVLPIAITHSLHNLWLEVASRSLGF
jgi:membrane protease YdiL (CAAX protease family)